MKRHAFGAVAAASAAVVLLAGCGTLLSGSATTTGGPDALSVTGVGQAPAAGAGGPTSGNQPTTSLAPSGSSTPAGSAGSAGPDGAAGSGGSPGALGGATQGTTPPTAASPNPAGPTGGPGAVRPGPPIQVGFVLTGTSNIGSYGFTAGNNVSEQQVDQALVNAVNAAGGVGGHKIEAVFATTDTASISWSSDFAAACATFTQDHHVVAVLGYDFNFDPGFEACLAKAGIPHLTTGFNVPDPATLRQYPFLWAMSVPNITARSLAKLEGAAATNYLTPANKLGVITDNCPGTQPSYNGSVKPWLAQHHYDVAATFVVTCTTGNNAGTAAVLQQVVSVVLQFRAAGVDRVVFDSVSEGPALALFSDAAEGQGYHPGYIVSSLGNMAELTGQLPNDQMRDVHGFGWLPTQDVSPSQFPPANAAQTRCLTLLKSQGVIPRSAADYQYVYQICDPVFLYQDALAATGGSTTGSAVSAAIGAVGSSFQSTLLLGGTSDFSPARQNDAVANFRPVDWSSACSCFAYAGPTMAMP